MIGTKRWFPTKKKQALKIDSLIMAKCANCHRPIMPTNLSEVVFFCTEQCAWKWHEAVNFIIAETDGK